MSKGVLCSPHRQTDTKVNTEYTLSGFQERFLQPIIKDRPNMKKKKTSTTPSCSGPIPAQKIWSHSVPGALLDRSLMIG